MLHRNCIPLGFLALQLVACGAASDPGDPARAPLTGGAGTGGGGSLAGAGSTGGGQPPLLLPAANETGGASAENGSNPDCTPRAIGIVRDFRADDGGQHGHADFQNLKLFTAQDYDPLLGYPEPGIVLATLGPDKKPVFAGKAYKTVRSQATFDQWYRDVAGVNMAVEHELPLTRDAVKGTLVFDTQAFFPVDAQGFGNYGPGVDGVAHNFHFTFELHMTFAYAGGEIFDFRGDDDLFVFINGQLVIDLGGVHAPMQSAVELDERAAALGISPGHEYTLDVFQAERFTEQSNFRLETSLSFTNCKPIFAEPR